MTFPSLVALAVCFYGVYSIPKECILSYNHQGDVTAVDCSNKNLTRVPTDFPGTVVSLKFYHNNISFIPNNTFKELSILRDLDLSFNLLSSLEPDVFRGLTSLEVLNLASNRIQPCQASYPARVFVDLRHLRSLNIQNNTDGASITSNTTYPDEALSQLVSLKCLHVDGISNVMLGEGFKALTKLELLDFSGYGGYCNLLNISEDMFSNIGTQAPLTLNMSQCPIRHIHPLTFKALPSLNVLDLEDNGHFRFENFMVASQSFSPSLKILNISTIIRGEFVTLYGKYFQHLRQTRLTEVIVESNNIICLDPLAISNLPETLKYLSLRDNKIMDARFLLRIVFMPHIEVLDIGKQIYFTARDSNRTSTWPGQTSQTNAKEYCNRNVLLTKKIVIDGKLHVVHQNSKVRMYPPEDDSQDYRSTDVQNTDDSQLIWTRNQSVNLEESRVEGKDRELVSNLGLKKSPCDYDASYSGFNIDIIPLPPSLHTLKSDNIKFGYTVPNATFTKSNSLRFLNLSSDFLYCLGGPIYGLHQLEILDLSNNECNDVNPIFFTDMPRLTHLYLHNNNLGGSLSSDLNGQTFSSQRNLKFLDLSENRIRLLPLRMFMNMENLERLVLSDNSLSALGARIGHMKNLHFLDLSHNEFVMLDKSLRQDLDKISLFSTITVNITGNRQLECSCDTFGFVDWISRTNVNFIHFNETSCVLKNGSVVPLHELEDILSSLWLECHEQTIFTVVLIIFACVLLVMGVCGTLYYRRWRLRYLYYIGRRRVNPYNSLGTPAPDGSVLDVFISYDEEDLHQRNIIQDEVLSKLQDRNITCLISETDFLCGRNTREIIEEAVLGTRKTLALLTNDFFKSRERELEFNMAVLHGMETRQDIVIPVAMETLKPENIPPEVKAFLKAYPCLDYQTDDEAFWEELVLKIRMMT